MIASRGFMISGSAKLSPQVQEWFYSAGILIVDYWIIRRQRLNVRDLYVEGGEYPLVNWPAMVALAAGLALALVGLVVPSLRPLYD